MGLTDEQLQKHIIREMFRRVGRDYDADLIDIRHDSQWFAKTVWTAEEDQDFHDWIVAELKKHRRHWGDRKRKSEAAAFLLNWGWKIDESTLESEAGAS